MWDEHLRVSRLAVTYERVKPGEWLAHIDSEYGEYDVPLTKIDCEWRGRGYEWQAILGTAKGSGDTRNEAVYWFMSQVRMRLDAIERAKE